MNTQAVGLPQFQKKKKASIHRAPDAGRWVLVREHWNILELRAGHRQVLLPKPFVLFYLMLKENQAKEVE